MDLEQAARRGRAQLAQRLMSRCRRFRACTVVALWLLQDRRAVWNLDALRCCFYAWTKRIMRSI